MSKQESDPVNHISEKKGDSDLEALVAVVEGEEVEVEERRASVGNLARSDPLFLRDELIGGENRDGEEAESRRTRRKTVSLLTSQSFPKGRSITLPSREPSLLSSCRPASCPTEFLVPNPPLKDAPLSRFAFSGLRRKVVRVRR